MKAPLLGVRTVEYAQGTYVLFTEPANRPTRCAVHIGLYMRRRRRARARDSQHAGLEPALLYIRLDFFWCPASHSTSHSPCYQTPEAACQHAQWWPRALFFWKSHWACTFLSANRRGGRCDWQAARDCQILPILWSIGSGVHSSFGSQWQAGEPCLCRIPQTL